MKSHDRDGASRIAERGSRRSAAPLPDIESIYNGPIPEPVRTIARLGSAQLLLLLQATAEAAFFAAMTRGQLATIRRRRAEGSFYPALLDDLALYRRQLRAWRDVAARLRQREAPPIDGRGF